MTHSKALTVKFNEIPAAGLDYRYSSSSGELNGPLFDLLGDFPVYEVSLHIKLIDKMVQLQGQISGELTLACSRCAEDFHTKYSKNFTTMYCQSENHLNSLSESVDELEGSFDLEFTDKNEIDLGEVAHEQIALEIPFQPLCKENCKGLCSHCGTNLNISSCECNSSSNANRFSPFEKLKGLRGD